MLLLPFFLFLSKKQNKKYSMRKHATNGQGDFMKRHGFIGLGGRMSYVTGIPNFLHEKNREADVGFITDFKIDFII